MVAIVEDGYAPTVIEHSKGNTVILQGTRLADAILTPGVKVNPSSDKSC